MKKGCCKCGKPLVPRENCPHPKKCIDCRLHTEIERIEVEREHWRKGRVKVRRDCTQCHKSFEASGRIWVCPRCAALARINSWDTRENSGSSRRRRIALIHNQKSLQDLNPARFGVEVTNILKGKKAYVVHPR